MKKYFFKIIPALWIAVLVACSSDNEFGIEQSEQTLNFRMVPDVGSFDIAAGDPALTFTMFTENSDIDHVTIWVELFKFKNDSITPRAILSEIDGSMLNNEGSSKVTFNLSDFTGALGLSNSDLDGGDIFTIYNIVAMNDGRAYPDTLALGEDKFINVENALITTSVSTSLTTNLSFPVLCPFVISEAVGMYAITRDDAGVVTDPGHLTEVVPGPGPNQVIFKNMYGHPEGYDVLVEVNPVTDVATVKKQVGWHSSNLGLPFGPGSVEGGGFYFSCTGFITVDLEYTVAAGSFGTYKFELTKVQ